MHDFSRHAPPEAPVGDGMAERIRRHDWAATPLGRPGQWPAVYRTAVDFMLAADVPMAALLGPDLVQVYNDPYRDVMGGRHPDGLGRPVHACGPESTGRDRAAVARVLSGETVTVEDGPRAAGRDGARFRLFHHPLRDGGGAVVGVLIVASTSEGSTDAGLRVRGATAADPRALLDEVERLRGALAEQARVVHDQEEEIHHLHDEEARVRTLMDGIPQLVWRAVDHGRWTWAGQQWIDFTGQDQDDTHGLGWLEPVHPDDRAPTLRAWAGAEAAQKLDVEHRLRFAKDGAYRWHHTRAAPVRDAEGHIVEWLGTSTDIDELRRLKDGQSVLVAELQHRTRNLMGIVRFLADKTAKTSADLDDFSASFRDRLDALGRVQSLLSRLDDHDRVTFGELMQAEMKALSGIADRVTLDGPPDVRLRSSTVQTLALALHELATNAIKHGALGQQQGRLAITWRLEDAGAEHRPWLHIDWLESGIVMPEADGEALRGGGQGRELIERALPYQLGARTSYDVNPDGVHCAISLPVSATDPAPD